MRKLWKPACLTLLGMGVLYAPWLLLYVVRQPDVEHGEIFVSILFYFMVFCLTFFAYLAVRGTRFRVIIVSGEFGKRIEVHDAKEEDGHSRDSEKASTSLPLRH